MLASLLGASPARVLSIAERGAVAGANSDAVMWANGGVINDTLRAIKSGDTLLVPNGTWHMYGGILGQGLVNVTVQIDGTLKQARGLDTCATGLPGSQLLIRWLSPILADSLTTATSGRRTPVAISETASSSKMSTASRSRHRPSGRSMVLAPSGGVRSSI